MCLGQSKNINHLRNIYVQKDFALNNLQWSIIFKPNPNQTLCYATTFENAFEEIPFDKTI